MPIQVDDVSTSRHVRFRAVPRANRTRPTANIPNRSATSSTTEPRVFGPWPPWQCFFAGASPGACTDVASPDRTRAAACAASHQQEAQQRVALLADVSQPLLASTGVLARNQSHVAADLLAALETAPESR